MILLEGGEAEVRDPLAHSSGDAPIEGRRYRRTINRREALLADQVYKSVWGKLPNPRNETNLQQQLILDGVHNSFGRNG